MVRRGETGARACEGKREEGDRLAFRPSIWRRKKGEAKERERERDTVREGEKQKKKLVREREEIPTCIHIEGERKIDGSPFKGIEREREFFQRGEGEGTTERVREKEKVQTSDEESECDSPVCWMRREKDVRENDGESEREAARLCLRELERD